MRKFGIYFTMVLMITILLPTVIVRTFKFVPKGNSVVGESLEENISIIEEEEEIPVKNIYDGIVETYSGKFYGYIEILPINYYKKATASRLTLFAVI